MSTLLLVLAALQGEPPRVSASVDRSDALVGEVVTLTIVVEATGTAPVRVQDPVLSGLEVQGTRDATHVQITGGVTRRTMTRELRLVATVAGSATIGPVRVRHDEHVAETASLSVAVTAASAATAPTLAPRVGAIIDGLPGPPADTGVAVQVLALPDSVRLGEQLDLVTLAWFRRDVRRQLRTPPTMAPPAVEGAWSYQQTTPSGVVASRRVGSHWYDLFVNHQVLFPLTAGAVRVGRATVTYALPLTYSFLSRELQHEVLSDSLRVAVSDLPAAGRPPDFTGAAGADLTLDLETTSRELRPGAAATVTAVLRGSGNVALWPEPRINWPDGLRVYPGDVRVDVEARDGRIGGTKRFEYLIVADSAGTHAVSPAVLSYFDTGTARYATLRTGSLELVAPPGTVPVAARAAPPPLRPGRTASLPDRLLPRGAGWWVLFVVLPPLLVLGVRAARGRPRRLRPGPTVDVHHEQTPLQRLDEAFRVSLRRLVPDQHHREGGALADALRAAGVDATLAAHATRARERLQGAVYGPETATDSAELEAEVREIVRALDGALRSRHRAVSAVLAVLLLAPAAAAAQAPTAERLYEAGAWRPAADSFLARAGAEPRVADHWYNAGAALFRLGEDGRAQAAWVEAARRAPRAAEVRRALRLVPRDPLSRSLVPVYPVTPTELLLLAAAAWIGGWLLLLRRPAPRSGGVLIAVAVLAGAAGLAVDRSYRQPVAITLEETVPLREAPYGTAPAPRQLVQGIAVRIAGAREGWLLVERGGARGWVRPGEVARL